MEVSGPELLTCEKVIHSLVRIDITIDDNDQREKAASDQRRALKCSELVGSNKCPSSYLLLPTNCIVRKSAAFSTLTNI